VLVGKPLHQTLVFTFEMITLTNVLERGVLPLMTLLNLTMDTCKLILEVKKQLTTLQHKVLKLSFKKSNLQFFLVFLQNVSVFSLMNT